MNPHKKITAPAMVLTCLAALALPLAGQPEVAATRTDSRIDVTIEGELFTSYRFSDDEKYPFFFPVIGPSGTSVTSMRNDNFPHHSSLFFSCDMVNGGNFWQDTLERGQIFSRGPEIVTASGPEIVITDACDWKRPGASQPLRDERRITIRAHADGLREIDFDITLIALEDVVIQKTNHSLFSARMDPALTPQSGGAMVNAEGLSGEKDTFGKPSPWLACHGPRGDGGESEGLAILQHPHNPGYPSPWFTRDYGFLSPTPMFWPQDGHSTRIASGESMRLRYRVLIFAGTPESVAIDKHHAKFAASE